MLNSQKTKGMIVPFFHKMIRVKHIERNERFEQLLLSLLHKSASG